MMQNKTPRILIDCCYKKNGIMTYDAAEAERLYGAFLEHGVTCSALIKNQDSLSYPSAYTLSKVLPQIIACVLKDPDLDFLPYGILGCLDPRYVGSGTQDEYTARTYELRDLSCEEDKKTYLDFIRRQEEDPPLRYEHLKTIKWFWMESLPAPTWVYDDPEGLLLEKAPLRFLEPESFTCIEELYRAPSDFKKKMGCFDIGSFVSAKFLHRVMLPFLREAVDRPMIRNSAVSSLYRCLMTQEDEKFPELDRIYVARLDEFKGMLRSEEGSEIWSLIAVLRQRGLDWATSLNIKEAWGPTEPDAPPRFDAGRDGEGVADPLGLLLPPWRGDKELTQLVYDLFEKTSWTEDRLTLPSMRPCFFGAASAIFLADQIIPQMRIVRKGRDSLAVQDVAKVIESLRPWRDVPMYHARYLELQKRLTAEDKRTIYEGLQTLRIEADPQPWSPRVYEEIRAAWAPASASPPSPSPS